MADDPDTTRSQDWKGRKEEAVLSEKGHQFAAAMHICFGPPRDGQLCNTTQGVVMLSIRSANRNDVTLLKTLILEMGEYEHLPILITEEALARDGFGPQPEFRVLIAEWDGQPAGYAFIFNCYSTFRGRGLFLEDLFVRSQFRGKNVGDTLLSHVAAIAREEDCFGIMLNVLAWNRPPIEFFQKRHGKFLDDWKTGCLDGEALRALTGAK